MRFHSLKELDDTEGTVRIHNSNQDTHIILHPAPSAIDPNDPLRWPKWRKNVAFSSVCAFAFLANFAIGGLSPAFYLLSVQFGKSQGQTSELLLWPILVFGVFVSKDLTSLTRLVVITLNETEFLVGAIG